MKQPKGCTWSFSSHIRRGGGGGGGGLGITFQNENQNTRDSSRNMCGDLSTNLIWRITNGSTKLLQQIHNVQKGHWHKKVLDLCSTYRVPKNWDPTAWQLAVTYRKLKQPQTCSVSLMSGFNNYRYRALMRKVFVVELVAWSFNMGGDCLWDMVAHGV